MFPNEEESSSTPVQGAVLLTLRHRPPVGDRGFLLFVGGSPPRSGFFVIGVFVLSPPPPASATPRLDKRSDDRCNRGMGGPRKEAHNHHRMKRTRCRWLRFRNGAGR